MPQLDLRNTVCLAVTYVQAASCHIPFIHHATLVCLSQPSTEATAVLCCAVLCFAALRCPVLCCAEGAVTRRQWPGCLPMGTGKREGCECSVRTVCKCVVLGGNRGKGRPGGHPLGLCCQARSSCRTPSRSACWCRRSSCNTHAIVLFGPKRAFSNVPRDLAWAYQTLMDFSMTWWRNSVPSVWGPQHSMRARYMEGVHNVAAHCSRTAGSQSWLHTEAAQFPTLRSSHSASRWRASRAHEIRPSTPRGGAPFLVVLHIGGTSCLAPCYDEVRQDSHSWDDVYAVRRYMVLRVTIKPVEGEATSRCVVGPPTSLISDPRRYGGLLLQPVAQRRGGKLALVLVGHQGEEREGAAEEPREVHLRQILRRRIHPDIKVRATAW